MSRPYDPAAWAAYNLACVAEHRAAIVVASLVAQAAANKRQRKIVLDGKPKIRWWAAWSLAVRVPDCAATVNETEARCASTG